MQVSPPLPSRPDGPAIPARPGPLVCVLAYDGLCTFEYGIAVEVFALPRPEISPWYRFCIAGLTDGPLRGLGGVSIQPDGDLTLLHEADLVLIPGWSNLDTPVPKPLCDALHRAHANGARLASICSGLFVLAATGLLDGQRATTHWRYAETFRGRHPHVVLDPDVLYVDNGRLLSSAGSAAGLDLCLHIVRQDFGSAVANQVAQRLVIPAQRDGGQRQFIPRPMPQPHGRQMGSFLDHLREHLNEDWPLDRMAHEAGVSLRTLIRRMKESTGQSPQSWLIGERINHAIDLLEETEASLDDIAVATGFKSQEAMRHHFRHMKGHPPSWYRPTGEHAAHGKGADTPLTL